MIIKKRQEFKEKSTSDTEFDKDMFGRLISDSETMEGVSVSDDQLVDEGTQWEFIYWLGMSVLLAGHETTSNVLGFHRWNNLNRLCPLYFTCFAHTMKYWRKY